MKYIDADRLQKEVKRLERAALGSALDCADSKTRKFHEGKALAYQFVGMLIDSLQQERPENNIPSAGSGAMGTTPPRFKLDVKEQPVEDLDEEMDKMWLYWCEDADYLTYASIARHFYELGRKAKEDK